MKTTLSSDFSAGESKVSGLKCSQKIFYIDRETHEILPWEILDEKEKIFVLRDPCVGFRQGKIVTVLKSCPIDVLYKLAETSGKGLHL